MQICAHCGKRAAAHESCHGFCPKPTISLKWSKTKTFLAVNKNESNSISES